MDRSVYRVDSGTWYAFIFAMDRLAPYATGADMYMADIWITTIFVCIAVGAALFINDRLAFPRAGAMWIIISYLDAGRIWASAEIILDITVFREWAYFDTTTRFWEDTILIMGFDYIGTDYRDYYECEGDGWDLFRLVYPDWLSVVVIM